MGHHDYSWWLSKLTQFDVLHQRTTNACGCSCCLLINMSSQHVVSTTKRHDIYPWKWWSTCHVMTRTWHVTTSWHVRGDRDILYPLIACRDIRQVTLSGLEDDIFGNDLGAVPYRKRMKISSISPNGPMAVGMSAWLLSIMCPIAWSPVSVTPVTLFVPLRGLSNFFFSPKSRRRGALGSSLFNKQS